jgi:hypothetical protein
MLYADVHWDRSSGVGQFLALQSEQMLEQPIDVIGLAAVIMPIGFDNPRASLNQVGHAVSPRQSAWRPGH